MFVSFGNLFHQRRIAAQFQNLQFLGKLNTQKITVFTLFLKNGITKKCNAVYFLPLSHLNSSTNLVVGLVACKKYRYFLKVINRVSRVN